MNFPIDITIEAEDICNLLKERDELIQSAFDGRHLVIFGRRNTGKTSLILNVVIPAFQKKHKKSLCVFVDYLGVDGLAEAELRLKNALEQAFAKAYPSQSLLKEVVGIAKSLRPNFGVDSVTGEVSVSLSFDADQKSKPLETLFQTIGELHRSIPVFLAFDEFQDISASKSLTALFRTHMQHLPKDLPIFVCGSKKHLLASMFGRHKAPFAGWGRDFEVPTIKNNNSYEVEYLSYANERLKEYGVSIDENVFHMLVQACDGIPEAVNTVLNELRSFKGKISEADMRMSLSKAVEQRRGRYEETLLKYRAGERAILIAIAKHGPVPAPKGKNFLALVPQLSPTNVFTSVQNLEINADIYRTDAGYIVADPLFAIFMRKFR